MLSNISIPKDKLTVFCRRNHIRKLSFFGSVLRSDFHNKSDIDLLVEFIPGHEPGFIRLAGMERELSNLFENKKVDIRTPQDLSPYFRNEVMASAEVHFAEK